MSLQVLGSEESQLSEKIDWPLSEGPCALPCATGVDVQFGFRSLPAAFSVWYGRLSPESLQLMKKIEMHVFTDYPRHIFVGWFIYTGTT